MRPRPDTLQAPEAITIEADATDVVVASPLTPRRKAFGNVNGIAAFETNWAPRTASRSAPNTSHADGVVAGFRSRAAPAVNPVTPDKKMAPVEGPSVLHAFFFRHVPHHVMAVMHWHRH